MFDDWNSTSSFFLLLEYYTFKLLQYLLKHFYKSIFYLHLILCRENRDVVSIIMGGNVDRIFRLFFFLIFFIQKSWYPFAWEISWIWSSTMKWNFDAYILFPQFIIIKKNICLNYINFIPLFPCTRLINNSQVYESQIAAHYAWKILQIIYFYFTCNFLLTSENLTNVF